MFIDSLTQIRKNSGQNIEIFFMIGVLLKKNGFVMGGLQSRGRSVFACMSSCSLFEYIFVITWAAKNRLAEIAGLFFCFV